MRRLNYGIYGLLPLLIFVSVFVTKTQIVWAQATPASFTTQGNGVSWGPILNRDGGFVAFSSFSSNFVPADTNNPFDLFFYDRTSKNFSRANGSSNGELSNGSTGYGFGTPSPRVISDVGLFVAFEGILSAPTDNTGLPHDIFVRDRQTEETARISVALDGTEANWSASQPSLSADGRFVAFSSSATNLVPDDTNGSPGFSSDVFVRNLQTGTTERVSIGPNGEQGNGDSDTPSISADGRYVAFVSGSTNWHTDNARSHIYVRDRVTQTTELITVPLVVSQDRGSTGFPIISADGRYVAFMTPLPSIFTDSQPSNNFQVLVRDRLLGTTTIASVSSNGTQSSTGGTLFSMSDDGRFILFWSGDSNLTPDDTSVDRADLYVRDLITGVTARVQNAPGLSGHGGGSMSGDGRIVAFGPWDASPQHNSRTDIYVTDNPLYASTTTPSGEHITVLSPNGGEVWEIGKTYEIRWDGADFPANTGVQIGLRDSRFDPNLGSGEGSIANTTNTGSYVFTVPQSLGFLSDGQLGGDSVYRIVVYLDGGGLSGKFDESDESFSIVPTGELEDHLPTIFALNQSSATWQDGIPEDHYINDTTITFSAILDDFDEGQLQFQVELREFDQPFTGEMDGGILTSGSVEAESVATIIRAGLTPGSYHWRARAIDASNATSDWSEFGESGNVDFTIASSIVDLAPQQNIIPGVICSPAKHLVFITHGWDDNVDGWVKDMALSMQNYINAHVPNPGEWSVCTFDWSRDAARVSLKDLVFIGTPLFVPPWDAYATAGLHGTVVGGKLALNKYESIHFIGHSAGSNVIQPAAELVRINTPATKIHLTFLDAYYPDGISLRYGLEPTRNGLPIPNRSDWWAEQYVDARGRPILAPTNVLLPHVYNFDVTERDGFQIPQNEIDIGNEIRDAENNFTGLRQIVELGKIVVRYTPYLNRVHAWPHIWYQASVLWPSDPSSDEPLAVYGHHLSLEGGKDRLPLEFPNIEPLNVCTFRKDIEVPCLTSNTRTGSSVNYLPAFNIQGNISRQSETGTVTFLDSHTAQATPGSPVWFEFSASNADTTNVLHFDYEFLTVPGSEEMMTVFVDDRVAYKIDERITDPGVHTASEISVGDLTPGEHTIGFRLDPFTDAKSAIKIGNVQLGLLTQETAIVDTSVKGLLDEALTKLKSITTGNQDTDTATDAVERDLEKVIADAAWLDRNTLSWPGGQLVLINEVGIVKALGDIVNKLGQGQRRSSVLGATEALYRDVQSEIVQSSALLAQLSLNEAKNSRAKNALEQRILDRTITQIQNMYDRAASMEARSPAQALQLYISAWVAAELLPRTQGI